eukprot:gene5180-5548_t
MGDDEWETVSSSKKKGKGSSNRAQTSITLSFNLKTEEVQHPVNSIRPENLVYVGQYLVHREKGIIKNRDKSVRRLPPPHYYKDQPVNVLLKPAPAPLNALEPFGQFSMTLIRQGLENPNEVLPDVHIIIGRGCLKKIMKCFENRHYVPNSSNHTERHDLNFAIKRQDHFLMIEDTEKWGLAPAHGYAFENYLTEVPNQADRDCFFYRNICYDLDGLRLLVGFEVDCVLNNPSAGFPSVELKSHNISYEPNMLDYWYTLALADTNYLCIGAIDKPNNTLVSIRKLQMHQLLPPDHEALRNRFSQLSMVLHWIKREFTERNGTTGSLIFDCSRPEKLSLVVTSS